MCGQYHMAGLHDVHLGDGRATVQLRRVSTCQQVVQFGRRSNVPCKHGWQISTARWRCCRRNCRIHCPEQVKNLCLAANTTHLVHHTGPI
jgi:hypothetical protein